MDIPKRIWICRNTEPDTKLKDLQKSPDDLECMYDWEKSICYDDMDCDAIECRVIPEADVEKVREWIIKMADYYESKGPNEIEILDLLKDGE